jgi:hypothetical protein
MSIQVTRLDGLSTAGQRAFENHAKSIQSAINFTSQQAVKGMATSFQFQQLLAALASLTQRVTNLEAEVAALENQPAGGGGAYPTIGVFVQASGFGFPAAVYETAPGVCDLADSSDPAKTQPLLGIATGSAASGGCNVTLLGDAASTTWSWTPGLPVYVGGAGALTQAPPDVLFPLLIGYATDAQTVCVAPQALQVPASLGTIPAGDLVFIPSACNLLTLASAGLRLDGGLILNGGLKEL